MAIVPQTKRLSNWTRANQQDEQLAKNGTDIKKHRKGGRAKNATERGKAGRRKKD